MARPTPTVTDTSPTIQGETPCWSCSPRERFADGIIHVLGVCASPIAAVLLIRLAILNGETVRVIAAAIYGTALVATLTLSAAYNLAPPVRAERLRRYDHMMIFLMIAATYTPFMLVVSGDVSGSGATGRTLLVVVWLLACAGAALKLRYPRSRERIFVCLYLALGWIGLAVIDVLVEVLPAGALLLLGAGGVLYTAGVAFHLWERLPYQNAIWHAFVLAGAACHYGAVLTVVAVP